MDESQTRREVIETLAKLPVSGLPRFDAALRASPPWGTSWPAWLVRLSPGTAERLIRFAGAGDAIGILLAGHRDGRVREAALPLLARQATPLSLGMLLLRGADWVPEVRDAAQRLLRNVVTEHGVAVLLDVLPIRERLGTGAARAAGFAQEMIDLLRDVSTAELVSRLGSSDRALRRAIARRLASRPDIGSGVDAALAQDDAVTLGVVALAALGRDPSAALAERLWQAPVASVRAAAVDALLTGSAAVEVAERALLDRSAEVRRRGQGHLKQTGRDVSGHYVRFLANDSARPLAVALALRGLAEMGYAGHPFVASFCRHRSAAVRKTACSVLGALDARQERGAVAALLGDPSRSVVRQASLVFVRFGLTDPEVSRLWSLAVTRSDDALWPALRGLDRWRRLDLACKGLLADDARASALGSALMRHVDETWNRSFAPPRESVREGLSRSLPLALLRLDRPLAQRMTFALRPFFPGLP